MDFQELFQKIETQDAVKTAAAQNHPQRGGASSGQSEEQDEAIKTASFYDDLGRQMAHQVFDDLVQQSVEEDKSAKMAHVLDRMGRDPAYAAELIKKHGAKFGQ